jgi:hypothetical protein
MELCTALNISGPRRRATSGLGVMPSPTESDMDAAATDAATMGPASQVRTRIALRETAIKQRVQDK